LSIEAQIAELKEFAKREHLEIVEFIEEAKTAKVPGREKFAEVIKKIEKKATLMEFSLGTLYVNTSVQLR